MKRFTTPIVFALLVTAFGTAGAQKPAYKRDMPAKLVKAAKVKEADAVAMARKALPHAEIASAELEREGGKLIYSFDMKTPGKDGIDEINIDAITGQQVGKPQHESSAGERKEARQEKAAAQKKKGGGIRQ